VAERDDTNVLDLRRFQNEADVWGISLCERFELENYARGGLRPLDSFMEEDHREADFRRRVADVLIANGMPKRAGRFMECSRFGYCLACEGQETHKFFAVDRCDFRFCPNCAPRMFLQLHEKHSPILSHVGAHPRRGFMLREITLTSVNTGTLTSQQIKKFNQDVKRTLKQLMRGVEGWGAIWSDEVGHNNLNLHAHVLFYGPYIEQRQLAEVWHAVSGHQVVWIKKAARSGTKALLYLLKYVSKPPANDPELIGQLEVAFYGCRRVHAVGLFYNFKPQETCQSKQDCKQCPRCGAKLRRILGTYRIEDLAVQGVPFIGAYSRHKERKAWVN
jgi:hypothetical protein